MRRTTALVGSKDIDQSELMECQARPSEEKEERVKSDCTQKVSWRWTLQPGMYRMFFSSGKTKEGKRRVTKGVFLIVVGVEKLS